MLRIRTAITVAAAVLATVVGGLAAGPADAAPASPLPTDAAAHGWIGFCDEAGHNVTGGSIDHHPFVWKAISSTTPPANYRGQGENAVMSIYQPRPGVPASGWSGMAITAASFYSTPGHPTVQSTYADYSLAQLIKVYPPQVNGLYVLRFAYGRANYGLYNAAYPTTTIQVVGHRWSVVNGGSVDCAAGRARSSEQLVGSVRADQVTPHRPDTAAETVLTGGAGAAGAHAITRAPQSVGGSSANGSADHADSDNSDGRPAAYSGRPAGHSSSFTTGVLPWLLAGVLLIALALVVVGRRRDRASARSHPDS